LATIQFEGDEMRFSEQIRQAILNCGRTRYWIAKRSGVHQSQLSRFVRGEAMLTLDTLDRVAAVLGLEVTVPESPKQHREVSEARTSSHPEK